MDKLTRHQRRTDRIKAGIPFGSPKILHHHINGELVVCENAAEHGCLEREKRLIEHQGKRKCLHCKRYDDIENLTITVNNQVYHSECKRLYMGRQRYSPEKWKELEEKRQKHSDFRSILKQHGILK